MLPCQQNYFHALLIDFYTLCCSVIESLVRIIETEILVNNLFVLRCYLKNKGARNSVIKGFQKGILGEWCSSGYMSASQHRGHGFEPYLRRRP